MAAEDDDLSDAVKKEVEAFVDASVLCLGSVRRAAGAVSAAERKRRALANFTTVASAQLLARSQSDLSICDAVIAGHRVA